jgi:urease accessory protein
VLRAREVVEVGEAWDTVTLTRADRHRRRIRLTTDGGNEFLLDLAKARVLRDGDRLKLDDGRLVLIRAALEDLLEVRAEDALTLARLAWHLGNRHTPVQVMPNGLRLVADRVLEHLLRDHLGADVRPVRAPFEPESGAYHGHEH